MTKDISKNWAQKCAESNGAMTILPEELNKEAEEVEVLKKDVEEKARIFNEANLELENKAQNFWYKVRKVLHNKNIEGALEKNLGWNAEAKKDGVKVVNIVSQSPQGMRM